MPHARRRRFLSKAGFFFREAQIAWDELYPFADKKALQGAKELGLGNSAEDLADLVGKKKPPVLVAALARMELAGGPETLDNS